MAANVEKTTVNPLDLKDCPKDTSLGQCDFSWEAGKS